MIVEPTTYGAHSAQVEMRLLINGLALSVTHMGPDFLLIESPIDHPPCDATLVLQVDQSERRWDVHLPVGISDESKRVTIAVGV